MNINNLRLRELQYEKRLYNSLYNQADKESEKRLYKGKLECVEREEKKILKRYGVET